MPGGQTSPQIDGCVLKLDAAGKIGTHRPAVPFEGSPTTD